MNNVNDLQEQFENLIKQGQELLEKMKENQNADTSKKVRWKPEENEAFWLIDPYGWIECDYWKGTTSDKDAYEFHNVFKTQAEAKKELDRMIAEQELLDLCDWEEGKPCYEIEYGFNEKRFKADSCVTYYCFSPYRFESQYSAQKAIATLGEEKLKLIFRVD